MSEKPSSETSPQIIVIADVESNAQAIVERILKPSGFHAWVQSEQAPDPDVLVVDVTQLRGDPLASLRNFRSNGDDSPAILLAAHFPLSRLRELFRLGVNDFLLKPYRPTELCQAITDVSETRSAQADTEILTSRMDGLREQLRRRTDEIRMLSEIGRAVVSLDDLNEILRSVVEAAAFVTDAEEASIYLAEPESKELVLRASKQAGDKHATLQKLRVSDTIVGEVFNSGQPILRQPSMEAGPVKVQTGFLVQSIVNVPLRMRNKVVGVLGVYNRLAPRTFNEHHLTLMMALADWAGVALEQATLKRSVKTKPLTPQPVSSAATPEFSHGVSQALETLEGILKSDPGNEEGIRQALDQLMGQLRGLDAMPVVNLDAEQSSEMVDISGLVLETAESMKNAA